MRTLGCSDKGFPTPAPSPLTRLIDLQEAPTLSKLSQNGNSCKTGVSSDGSSTTHLPAANAAANFNDVWFVGKFQWCNYSDTPIASLTTKSSPRRSSNS